MLLEGKKLLITGVLTPKSIAFSAAQVAQEQGAEIVLTNFGRTVSLSEKSAKRLPDPPDVLEMDVNEPEQIDAVREELGRRWGRLDGFLHAIAFAPQDALGGNFLHTPWESVATAFKTSAFSLSSLAVGMLPLMEKNGGGDRLPRLRRARGLAGLRLDGRREGGARIRDALSRAGPRSQGDPGEHRVGRSDEDDGGEGDPRVRSDRGKLGRTSPARMGHDRRSPGRRRDRVPPLGSGERDHRGVASRGRRVPRDGHGSRARRRARPTDAAAAR